jgi:MATE family multidrug resistance protein
MRTQNHIAVSGTSVRDVFRLAWPVMVSMLSYTAMGLVDTLFVARLGTVHLAAVGFAATLVFTSQSFGGGLMAGVRVVVAQLTGAGEHRQGTRAAWQGLWLAGVMGVVVAALSMLGPMIFVRMGASTAVALHADCFFAVRVLGAPVVFCSLALSAWFQGRGDTRTPMVATLISNGLNIALDPILIFGLGPVPALGVSGAATATVISLCLGAIYLALRARCALVAVPSSPSIGLLRSIWRLGGPMGVRYFLEMCSFAVFAAMLASVGAIELAAHVLVVRIISVSFLPGHAVSEATAVIVGQLIGAGQRLRAWAAFRSALRLSLGIMLGCGFVFVLVPHVLLMPFEVEAGVMRVALDLLLIAAVFQVFDAYVMAAHGAMNGAGDTRFVMICSVTITWLVKLPIAWWLAIELGMGAVGAWLGLTAEIVVLAIVCWTRIRSGRWLEHEMVRVEEEPEMHRTG